jgi:alcohol dehydrogenase
MQELVRVPYADVMLKQLPADVRPEQAVAASDNLAEGYRTVAPYLNGDPGQSVLILGGVGSCGLYAVSLAVALGVSPVFMDTDRERLELATRLGARAVEAPQTESPGKFELVVDSTNTRAGLMSALRSVDYGGVCACISVHFQDDIAIPYWTMHNHGVTLKIGRGNAGLYIDDILKLISSGKLQPEMVTMHTIPWEDAPDAYKQLRATKLVVKF